MGRVLLGVAHHGTPALAVHHQRQRVVGAERAKRTDAQGSNVFDPSFGYTTSVPGAWHESGTSSGLRCTLKGRTAVCSRLRSCSPISMQTDSTFEPVPIAVLLLGLRMPLCSKPCCSISRPMPKGRQHDPCRIRACSLKLDPPQRTYASESERH